MYEPAKVRVLVAEDDYLVSEEIARELKEIGHIQVGQASNGQEAVELVGKLRPDVVLMDIKMPVLDGLEAARQIQESWPTPVIVVSAHESHDLVAKAGTVGVAAYLTKPPRRGDIERAIAVALARHEDVMNIRRLCNEAESRNRELQEALGKVKLLSGLLPVCAACRKIRDDHGYWTQIEAYIRDHSEAEFTHGICPACMERLYPDFVDGGEETAEQG